MRLGELIAPIGEVGGPTGGGAPDGGDADVEIAGLAYDSRKVRPGMLFFCVRGLESDGHDFAQQAVANGAGALVVEHPLGLSVPEVQVSSARACMGPVAARFYDDPTSKLKVVGVTGTNGKTTTAFLVHALLEASGEQAGLLGTVKSIVAGRERPVERTTPEAIDLQADFRAMLDGGDSACVMEVSSHALVLGRAEAIHFSCAIFTNLTRDHLDFHDTMEDYFQAKRGLFTPAPGVSVVNVGDPYGRRLAQEIDEAVTFAVEDDADYSATDLRCDVEGCRFELRTPAGRHEVMLPMPGRFNVANALGALASVHELGGNIKTLIAALERGVRVPGRFEPVQAGQEFAVIVDYAHTPDSLENVLRAARDIARGRIICVFGAGGDRDRGKRPLMGEIAARLADVTIVTSDNPRSEAPEAIIAEIVKSEGPIGDRLALQIEVDRRMAIERAIALAETDDVVVIAGKGHEQGQELADAHKIPFDDVTVAREALRARMGAKDWSGRMRSWDSSRVASAAGARLVVEPSRSAGDQGPQGAVIDSRKAGPGDLFVGLVGEHADGGEYAAQALQAGAWGVLVAPDHALAAAAAAEAVPRGAVFTHEEPLTGLQSLARSWLGELQNAGAKVVAITGSTGKTSTKDILAALLRPHLRILASPENFNTEIGMPLAVLAAPAGTEALVLELAMRGPGQIAQLTAIAQPDVGVIVNVGPVHLELLGTLEAIAAAKAELIAGLAPGASVVIPADEPLLVAHLRADVCTITFGEAGDVALAQPPEGEAGGGKVVILAADRSQSVQQIVLEPSFGGAHNLRNLLAAVAGARALGITPEGRVDVSFSALRGELIALPEEIALINDCYNANPMSMRAAIDELVESAPARRVAVLGDMLELGPEERNFHREIGAHAAAMEVNVLVTVGPLAAEMHRKFIGESHAVPDATAAAELLEGILRARDTVLVKGSRAVGLEYVAEALSRASVGRS